MAGSIKVHFLRFNLHLFACNALSGDLGCFLCWYHAERQDVSDVFTRMCLS